MLTVVVYDIPDDKRRRKLAKFLEGYGRRVQFSVFECFLTLDEMRLLHRLVQERVNVEEDNVRFYWISSDADRQHRTGTSSKLLCDLRLRRGLFCVVQEVLPSASRSHR
jgi:CRISPR-associated protein Cas2